jgi:hypothetical protein
MRRLAALVVAGILVSAPRPGSASEGDAERAEAAFREGNRAFAVGDYHAAFSAYRQAWSLKQAFDIACNLGRTEVELSLYRDAAEHLDYCLRTFSVSSRGEVRDANKRFHDLFVRVRAEVSALSIDARPAGAEITVDGASYGVSPLGHDIFLDPGTHRVRARLPGFQADERSVVAEAGGTLSVSLTLSQLPPVAPVAPVAVRPAEPKSSATLAASPERGMQPRTVVLLSGAGLSLVALGIGLGFAVDANAARDNAAELGNRIHQNGEGSCARAGSADCLALTNEVSRQQNSHDAAQFALITSGGIAAATLAAWLLIPDVSYTTQVGKLQARPVVGRSYSGASLYFTY